MDTLLIHLTVGQLFQIIAILIGWLLGGGVVIVFVLRLFWLLLTAMWDMVRLILGLGTHDVHIAIEELELRMEIIEDNNVKIADAAGVDLFPRWVKKLHDFKW